MKTAGVTRVITRVTLKSVLRLTKSPFCTQLMIVCVFQHNSDIFRLIDVINGVIFFFRQISYYLYIDITSRDTCLPHTRFLSCARL